MTARTSHWDRMFDAWVKHQAGLPSAVPLWPNPDWPQDVAMVARALAVADDELQRVRQGYLDLRASFPPVCCGGAVQHEPNCPRLASVKKPARRAYHARGTYWNGVPSIDMPCDFCARPFVDHDPRTHACPPA